MLSLGDKLRELRTGRRLTQREVSVAIGIAVSTLGMYESGRREPDLTTLSRLADYYGVTVDYLVGKESSDTTPEEQLLRLGAYLRGSGATEEDVETIMALIQSRRRLREAAEREQGD